MTIEESLEQACGKAALLRYLAAVASTSDQAPDAHVFAGIEDVCGEIERLTRAVRKGLGVEELEIEVP
jgi:hypothetical protein